MAYSRPVGCRQPGCTGKIAVEVVGRFNYSEGFFCAVHGKRRLEALLAIETVNQKLETERPELRGKLR